MSIDNNDIIEDAADLLVTLRIVLRISVTTSLRNVRGVSRMLQQASPVDECCHGGSQSKKRMDGWVKCKEGNTFFILVFPRRLRRKMAQPLLAPGQRTSEQDRRDTLYEREFSAAPRKLDQNVFFSLCLVHVTTYKRAVV